MTKEQYNELPPNRKLDVAWYLWNTYIEMDSDQYDSEVHYGAYGLRRMFVNSRNIARRGKDFFELDKIAAFDAKSAPVTENTDFPIFKLTRRFVGVKAVRVSREISQSRFYWIDFDVKIGDVFYNKNDSGYGSISSWGLSCNNDHFDWSCEIPMQYIEPLEKKN